MLALELALLFLVALAPPVILAIRLRNAELHRREPWRVLWRAFAWGAIFAAFIAIVIEKALDPRFADMKLFLPTLSVSIVVLAPLAEELAKALGLRLINDRRDAEPEDGYIYGGAVGLGFGATENVFYILSAFLFAGEDTAFATALYRGLVTVPLHGAVSAIAGAGIWRARATGKARWGLWGLSVAIVIHMAYNALAAQGGGWAMLLGAAIAVVAYLRIMRRVAVLDARV